MRRWWNRPRFDSLELLLILAFASYCVWRAAASIEGIPSEAGWLIRAYGPFRYSRNLEELVVRDFFADNRDGFFVDVGAGDYRLNSNTFYLDNQLGWHGIAIDPRRELEADYRKYRPRTRFFAFFVSDVSRNRSRFFLSDRFSERSSGNQDSAALQGGSITEITVPTVTLTDLLNQQRVSHIDLLSIDIELSEPRALAGFDIERFRPGLVCIEAHPQVRQQILDYFAKHRYVLLGRYLRADPVNLYFAPLS